LLLLQPDPQTPFKGKLGVRKVCAWSQPISLNDVKAFGRVTGGTVNDVLLTAVSGALGRYLHTRGEPAGGLDFRAVVPVNLRPADEKPKLGNAFGLVVLSLPVGIADPLDRLFALKERMDAIKGTSEALVAFGILNMAGLSTSQIQDIIVKIFGLKATAVMTNVPGPRQVRYLAGKAIDGLMFWVPQSGKLGLGVSILSYNNQVLLGIATDAGLVPDPETIIEGFHQEFEAMMELVRLAAEADAEIEHT
jgi:WS/DGAT/MGAT family acyltransferase